MLDFKALTKIQTAILISIVSLAAVSGAVLYYFSYATHARAGPIIVGVCADLDMGAGRSTFRGAMLAVEQLNAEGGLLGRNIIIVSEDDDSETPPYDVAIAANALTKLITVDRADFIISTGGLSGAIASSVIDICAEQKKILFTTVVNHDDFTQRVLDNYNRYKYYFRVSPPNASAADAGMLDSILTVGSYTNFTKIAFLFQDYSSAKSAAQYLNGTLPKFGFQIVYSVLIPRTTIDFTSYFAAAEAAGAEIIFPYVAGSIGAAFVKEWYNRQSPTVVWGILTNAGDSGFWNLTAGGCDTVSFSGFPVVSGYPLTNKTVSTREAYINRWGTTPDMPAAGAYDGVRFILSDAIKRAGTIETEAVIKELEKTSVETSSARRFTFTPSHDIMVGGDVNNPAENYMVVFTFQWQNGIQVPVKPEAIMKEVGATYKYPDWTGPWSKNQTP